MSHLVSKFRPDLLGHEALYRQFHRDPELLNQEQSTAATVNRYLQNLLDVEVEVKANIGGHGVVGIYRNGDGPTVLLRAELDALPVLEQTSLPYASTKIVPGPDGRATPVMHACGHDLHMTALLAAAKLLVSARESWAGTVVFLFQPSEEDGAGAQRMVDDGLYDPKRHGVPRPDVVLGGHVMPARAGTITTRGGVFNSASESFRVTLYGRGGHGGKPHATVDPVVLACSAVMKLQTVVSRETDPQDAAVVTVGAIHAGRAANVIPDEAVLLVNTRAFNEATQTRLRQSIRRIVAAEALAAGSPKEPLIEKIGGFPLLRNDDAAAEKVAAAMKAHFGDAFSTDAPISTGSEDFSNLATPVGAQVCFWNYGGIDPAVWDKAERKGKLEEIPSEPIIVSVEVQSLTMLQATTTPDSPL